MVRVLLDTLKDFVSRLQSVFSLGDMSVNEVDNKFL